MRSLLTLVVTATALVAAQPSWLAQVAPVITPAEKKTYLALPPSGRADFEARFWEGKAISAGEYFRRLSYVDATFGSSKAASGANTDPGRVYLAIGPPAKITHFPSSRVFVPLEIWYYDSVPGALETELRLIFYQKNSVGLMKLYSPTVDTLRALLIPQASVQNLWGPNDTITEADIRNKLNIRPTEDEVISAALNVATGIKYSGNDEILGMITSPGAILRRPPETRVTSRFSVLRPKLDVIQTASAYGGAQIDLRLEAAVTRELDLEVLEDAAAVYQNKLLVKEQAGRIEYRHRLDLLPGSYRVVFTVDGKPFVYPLEIREKPAMSGIFRIDEARERVRRVLAVRPNDFQALAVFAYIETRLQDYGVAADLYRRALAVQDSPALRAALAQLPSTQTTSQ